MAERVTERGDDALTLTFPRSRSDDPQERLRAPSPFSLLRFLSTGLASASPEEPFALACVGIVAFDHVDLLEDLPEAAEDPLGFPDFLFWLAETLVVFEPGAAPRAVCTAFGSADPAKSERAYFGAAQRLAALVGRCGKAEAVAAGAAPGAACPIFQADLDDEAYGAVVTRMKEHIAAGDVYQIVPSRTFRTPCADPMAAFAAQRRLDPSPYHFFVSGARPHADRRVARNLGAAVPRGRDRQGRGQADRRHPSARRHRRRGRPARGGDAAR